MKSGAVCRCRVPGATSTNPVPVSRRHRPGGYRGIFNGPPDTTLEDQSDGFIPQPGTGAAPHWRSGADQRTRIGGSFDPSLTLIARCERVRDPSRASRLAENHGVWLRLLVSGRAKLRNDAGRHTCGVTSASDYRSVGLVAHGRRARGSSACRAPWIAPWRLQGVATTRTPSKIKTTTTPILVAAIDSCHTVPASRSIEYPSQKRRRSRANAANCAAILNRSHQRSASVGRGTPVALTPHRPWFSRGPFTPHESPRHEVRFLVAPPVYRRST